MQRQEDGMFKPILYHSSVVETLLGLCEALV